MKNIKMDTKGHIISYESDSGVTITDYKALSKSMGLSNSSSNGDYCKCSGGASLPDGLLWIMCGAIILGTTAVFLVIAWLFFGTAFAIALTVLAGIGLIAGILFMFKDSIGKAPNIFNSNLFYWTIIIAVPLILIIFPIVAWLNWSLTASIVWTIISVFGLGIYGYVFFKYIYI